MKEFKDILKDLRIKNNLTQEELAEKVGLKKAAIYKYENGINDNPSRQLISGLARALNTSPAYLVGWTDENPVSNRTVPLIGQIACGLPILANENIEDYFSIDNSIKADFCLRARGDSMIDEGIYPGDIVFIRKQETLENGEIGAVIIENEATLKRFYKTDGQVILQPANNAYQPIVLDHGNVHIAGKLVAILNIRS